MNAFRNIKCFSCYLNQFCFCIHKVQKRVLFTLGHTTFCPAFVVIGLERYLLKMVASISGESHTFSGKISSRHVSFEAKGGLYLYIKSYHRSNRCHYLKSERNSANHSLAS